MEIKKNLMFLGFYDKSYDFEDSHIIRYQVDFYDSVSGNSLSFNVYDNDKTITLINCLLNLKRGDDVTVLLNLQEKEKGLYKLILKDIEVA